MIYEKTKYKVDAFLVKCSPTGRVENEKGLREWMGKFAYDARVFKNKLSGLTILQVYNEIEGRYEYRILQNDDMLYYVIGNETWKNAFPGDEPNWDFASRFYARFKQAEVAK